MGRNRIIGRATLVAVLVIPAGAAFAQSDICTRLEARLMALESRAGVGDLDKSWALEKAIRNQREDLDKATAEARRAGCLGLLQRLKTDANCGPITTSISRMRANLARLTAARDRADDDRFGGGAEHRELVRALAANQCGPHYEQDYAQPARRGGLLETLFGRRLFRDRGWDAGPRSNGTFRTLCVRTCDGYYFPISFTAIRSQFARDAQRCRSMCPGTEVALYVHRNPGEEAEAMISLAGDPYVTLPTAFRYRREYDPVCKCGQVVAASPASEQHGYLPEHDDDPWSFARGAEMPEPLDGDPPVPLPPPASGEDPETLANRSGGLIPEAVEPPAPAAAGFSADGERHVRIVGPAYFFGQ